jgi:hypothetical protein
LKKSKEIIAYNNYYRNNNSRENKSNRKKLKKRLEMSLGKYWISKKIPNKNNNFATLY